MLLMMCCPALRAWAIGRAAGAAGFAGARPSSGSLTAAGLFLHWRVPASSAVCSGTLGGAMPCICTPRESVLNIGGSHGFVSLSINGGSGS